MIGHYILGYPPVVCLFTNGGGGGISSICAVPMPDAVETGKVNCFIIL